MAKKQTAKLVRCMDCRNASLMQWGSDPVIATCSVKDGDRDVARSSRCCTLFRQDVGDKPIRRMDE